MKQIKSINVEKALKKDRKHFFVGKLTYPQLNEWIDHDKVEIRIANLPKKGKDNKHWHKNTDEFIYVLEGKMTYSHDLKVGVSM